ncbi:Holliday junction branch migration protein RuvA [Thiotrichales bacterium 19S9-12]|nr:Holliday junction branch migration protein RuvA [Thiotrichales bacterium 19S9-11]MCF6811182.1 Holliday junction branch migration protein RuvA [Thiotrichales bacterium 19S9-12]
MIGRIRGLLIERQAPTLLVETGGVGYEILAPMTTIYQLPEVDEEVILYTHFVVREDAQQLYGFISKTDRRIFQELIKVNGIGAKMALAILSGMDAQSVLACIERDDSALLVSIPGIGKKTAERLIVEMRDKIPQMMVLLSDIQLTDTIDVSDHEVTNNKSSNDISEATEALMALGYRKNEAQKVLYKVKDEASTTEELIKSALQKLMRH